MSCLPVTLVKFEARTQLTLENAVLVEKTPGSVRYQWTFSEGNVDFKVECKKSLHGPGSYSIRYFSDFHRAIKTTIGVKNDADGCMLFGPEVFVLTNDFRVFREIQHSPSIGAAILEPNSVLEVMFDVPTHYMRTENTTGINLNMLHEKTFADCTFKIGDDEIKAHRCFLAQSSEVFRAMFSQESTNEAKNGVIEIKDSDYDSVNTMLKFMYTGSVKPTDENLEGVLFLADKYDLQPLREACIDFLIGIVDGTNVVRMAVIGDLYSSSDIIKKCGEYLKKNRPAILNSDEWKALRTTNRELVVRLFELMY